MFHQVHFLIKVSVWKIIWSTMAHLKKAVLLFFGGVGSGGLFCHPGWVGEFGGRGEGEQVRLKSCQSCVSALRHSQNVFWRGGGTGCHDCRSILLPCLPVLTILNKKQNKTVFIFCCSWNWDALLCTCRPVTDGFL